MIKQPHCQPIPPPPWHYPLRLGFIFQLTLASTVEPHCQTPSTLLLPTAPLPTPSTLLLSLKVGIYFSNKLPTSSILLLPLEPLPTPSTLLLPLQVGIYFSLVFGFYCRVILSTPPFSTLSLSIQMGTLTFRLTQLKWVPGTFLEYKG